MNKVFLIGNLGVDPEVRQVGSSSVCSFTVGARTRQKNDAGEYMTNWYRVSVWGKMGESCAANLHKGDKVSVSGELSFREYTGRNGDTRQSNEVRADDIEFLTPKGNAAPTQTVARPVTKPSMFEEDDDLPPF